jgi:hypothetical protein
MKNDLAGVLKKQCVVAAQCVLKEFIICGFVTIIKK